MDKVVPLLTARRVDMIQGFKSEELGASCGRESVSVLGVLDAGLARGIRSAAPDAVVVADGRRQTAEGGIKGGRV